MSKMNKAELYTLAKQQKEDIKKIREFLQKTIKLKDDFNNHTDELINVNKALQEQYNKVIDLIKNADNFEKIKELKESLTYF